MVTQLFLPLPLPSVMTMEQLLRSIFLRLLKLSMVSSSSSLYDSYEELAALLLLFMFSISMRMAAIWRLSGQKAETI